MRDILVRISDMTNLAKMTLAELEDLATKLRHAIARNPEHLQVERVELEDLKQWVAIRQTRDSSDSEL